MAKKQKSGLYRASVTVGGKRIYVSAHSQRQLQAQKQRVRRQFETGTTEPDLTFYELVQRWWQDVKLPSIKTKSHVYHKRCMIEKHIMRKIDDRKLAKAIRRTDLQQYINTIPETKSRAVICGMIKSYLIDICSYGMELGVMTANYAQHLVIARDTELHHRKPAVTKEQMINIMDHAHGTWIELPVMVLYYTGVRTGEMMALTWGDIDWTSRKIHINKNYDYNTQTVGNVKTVNAIRDVDLLDPLYEFLYPLRGLPAARLTDWPNQQKWYTLWVQLMRECGYATHKEGAPQNNSRTSWQVHITPHQIRHTYATTLYESGIDTVTASRLMGHSSYAVTADIYTDISEAKRKSCTEKLNDAFTLHNNSQNQSNAR